MKKTSISSMSIFEFYKICEKAGVKPSQIYKEIEKENCAILEMSTEKLQNLLDGLSH